MGRDSQEDKAARRPGPRALAGSLRRRYAAWRAARQRATAASAAARTTVRLPRRMRGATGVPRAVAPGWLAGPPARSVSDLRVAAVLDPMSTRCFGAETTVVTFGPEDWPDVLDRQRPHLLLVESAWNGNSNRWQYRVGHYPSRPEVAAQADLRALVAWCREHGVPTVFWNKEDPVHFDRFQRAAALFDVVLTTDADLLDRYRALGGPVRHVGALPFSAQVSLHNPVGSMEGRSAQPVFAGTFYRNRHPERQRQLEGLLDAAVPYDLVIYDRMHGATGEDFGFPERFAPHIRGSLSYDDMVRVYKRHKVFLNTNSVTASPTMFSRRVFELLACGTPVVSTPSRGMTALFGDTVAVAAEPEEAAAALARLLGDEAHWRRVSAEGVRAVMTAHTYRHRLATIAAAAGIPLDPDVSGTVAALLPLEDGDDAASVEGAVVDALSGPGQRPAEVVVGAPPSAGGRAVEALRAALPGGRVLVVDQDVAVPLADRVRVLAAAASTPWVTVLAGSGAGARAAAVLRHLDDLVACTAFAAADVVGLQADESEKAPWHVYTPDGVDPAYALARRELVAEHGWAAGEPEARALHARWSRYGIRFYTGSRVAPFVQRNLATPR